MTFTDNTVEPVWNRVKKFVDLEEPKSLKQSDLKEILEKGLQNAKITMNQGDAKRLLNSDFSEVATKNNNIQKQLRGKITQLFDMEKIVEKKDKIQVKRTTKRNISVLPEALTFSFYSWKKKEAYQIRKSGKIISWGVFK